MTEIILSGLATGNTTYGLFGEGGFAVMPFTDAGFGVDIVRGSDSLAVTMTIGGVGSFGQDQTWYYQSPLLFDGDGNLVSMNLQDGSLDNIFVNASKSYFEFLGCLGVYGEFNDPCGLFVLQSVTVDSVPVGFPAVPAPVAGQGLSGAVLFAAVIAMMRRRAWWRGMIAAGGET